MKMLNQQGAALVIVLITITVFTIVGATVMSSTLNTTKQTIITEENIQGTHLAEMGVDYYKAKIEKSLIQLNNLNNIQQEVQKAMNYNSDFSFKIENIVITETSLPTKDILEITFDSKGYKKEKQIGRTVTGVVYLEAPSNPSNGNDDNHQNQFPEKPLNYNEVEHFNLDNNEQETLNNDILVNDTLELKNNSELEVYKNLYVNGQTTLNNNSIVVIHETGFFNRKTELENNSLLTVYDHAYFNEGLDLKNGSLITIKHNAYFFNFAKHTLTLSNNTQIIIEGDAYFYNSEHDLLDLKNQAKICVKKTLYYEELPPSHIIISSSCPSNGTGIYAKEIQLISNDNETDNEQWEFSPHSLDVNYNK